jgi:hypothetical protein
MALVEKSHGRFVRVFPFSPGIGASRRILKTLSFLTAFGLAFFGLGFAFGHGYWVIALWSAAAAVAWRFMRGASEASLPSERYSDE